MTITMSIIYAPIAVTLAAIVLTIFLPMPARHGDYDFAPEIRFIAMAVVGVIVILASWLVYFAFT